jgi:hypothetical protein
VGEESRKGRVFVDPLAIICKPMKLLGASVLVEVPRRDAPVKGEVLGVGYPILLVKPTGACLEAVDGRPIRSVVRAVWDVEVEELRRQT